MCSVKQISTKFCLRETIYLGIFLIPVFTHNTLFFFLPTSQRLPYLVKTKPGIFIFKHTDFGAQKSRATSLNSSVSHWNPQRPTLPFHCSDNALPPLAKKKALPAVENWKGPEQMRTASLRRGQSCSSIKKRLSDKQNQIPVHWVCWLPLLWTLIFNPAGFKAGEKMTYHLKAIFPFSGILALENISSNISTFHISRDYCNFFIALCLMSG